MGIDQVVVHGKVRSAQIVCHVMDEACGVFKLYTNFKHAKWVGSWMNGKAPVRRHVPQLIICLASQTTLLFTTTMSPNTPATTTKDLGSQPNNTAESKKPPSLSEYEQVKDAEWVSKFGID